MTDDKSIEALEEDIQRLEDSVERKEKKAELQSKRRRLWLQDRWWGQILLGSYVVLQRVSKKLGGVLDAWSQPPENGERLRHPRPERQRRRPPEPDEQDPEKRDLQPTGLDVAQDAGFDEARAVNDLHEAMGGGRPLPEDVE